MICTNSSAFESCHDKVDWKCIDKDHIETNITANSIERRRPSIRGIPVDAYCSSCRTSEHASKLNNETGLPARDRQTQKFQHVATAEAAHSILCINPDQFQDKQSYVTWRCTADSDHPDFEARLKQIEDTKTQNPYALACPQCEKESSDPKRDWKRFAGARASGQIRTVNSINRSCAKWKLEVDWTSYKNAITVCLWRCRLGHVFISTTDRIERRQDAQADPCRICRQREGNRNTQIVKMRTHADFIAKSGGKLMFAPEEFYPELVRDRGELTALMTTPIEKVVFFDAEYSAALRLNGAQALPANAINEVALVDGTGRVLLDSPVDEERFDVVKALIASVLDDDVLIVVWNKNNGDQKVLQALINEDARCVNMCRVAQVAFKDYESVSLGYLYWSLFGQDLEWHTAAADAMGTLAVTQFILDQCTLLFEPLAVPAVELLHPVAQEDSLVKAAALRHEKGNNDRLPTPEEISAAKFVKKVTIEMVELKRDNFFAFSEEDSEEESDIALVPLTDSAVNAISTERPRKRTRVELSDSDEK